MLVYTDGAASPDGWGGWAWATEHESDSGFAADTTNQQMEMLAVVRALEHFVGRRVTICSDSAYVINCFEQKWYVRWRLNGWRNSKGEPVANREQWEYLIILVETSVVRFRKIKGHAGDPLNEEADRLAVQAKHTGRLRGHRV